MGVGDVQEARAVHLASIEQTNIASSHREELLRAPLKDLPTDRHASARERFRARERLSRIRDECDSPKVGMIVRHKHRWNPAQQASYGTVTMCRSFAGLHHAEMAFAVDDLALGDDHTA